MSSRRKLTDREVKATALNKKEDRVLQKTFGTLNLEMSFTYNVLSLHVRTVKANFRRLRDKVDKLKSNLKPEEITMLRQLEEEGKFKPATTFNVNAAMKIAAAARRLNLYPEGIKRSHTMLSPKRRRTNEKLLTSRSSTDMNLLKGRSNSVTGVFMDAPAPETRDRRNSIDSSNPSQSVIRPVSAAQVNNEEPVMATKKSVLVRPSTSNAIEREITTLSKVSFQSSPAKATAVTPSPEISTNDILSRGDYVPEKGKTKSPRDKMSAMHVTDESLDSGRTKVFEDRRQELLQDEQLFLKALEKRKTEFIHNVDHYLNENPPPRFDLPFNPAEFPPLESAGTDDDEEEVMKYTRRRRQMRNYDSTRTFTSEEEYKKREGELWKDMNKTRYLRVSDDMLDLSGVVTLAKDQMKLFKALQYTEPSHIVTQ